MTERGQKIKVLLAFIAIYFVWGTTYLAAIVGLESFPPFLLSALRFCSAGTILFAASLLTRGKFPAGRNLSFVICSGILMLVGGSALVTWSEQYILSGYAAVVVASEPFFFVLLDRPRWQYYFGNRNIIAGLLLGFVGVALFVSVSATVELNSVAPELVVTGYAVLFLSCVLWVIGSIFSSRTRDTGTSIVAQSAVQLLAAGVFSLLLALATNELENFVITDVTVRAWGGLIFLTLGGSVVAYLSFVWLLTVRSPAQVSTHTYINPIIALFMGWWIMNDPVNYLQIVSVAIIIFGVLLTNRNNKN
jgi:drug/metabolite transporter (DMT)-like permease